VTKVIIFQSFSLNFWFYISFFNCRLQVNFWFYFSFWFY